MHRQIGTVKLDKFIILWATVCDRYKLSEKSKSEFPILVCRPYLLHTSGSEQRWSCWLSSPKIFLMENRKQASICYPSFSNCFHIIPPFRSFNSWSVVTHQIDLWIKSFDLGNSWSYSRFLWPLEPYIKGTLCTLHQSTYFQLEF